MKNDLSPFDVDILLIGGLQGSGKSSLAMSAFGDRRRVNRDEIRSFHKQLTTGQRWEPHDWHAGVEPLVTEIEMAVLRHELVTGHKVVVDNTCITARLRRPYIELARELGKTIGCVFLDLPLEYCLERNRTRDRQVPDRVMTQFHASQELPSSREGLDLVQVVDQPVARFGATGPIT